MDIEINSKSIVNTFSIKYVNLVGSKAKNNENQSPNTSWSKDKG